MPNMNYCRFSNTLSDLKDCCQYMDDQAESPEEEEAKQKLIKLCRAIAADYEE